MKQKSMSTTTPCPNCGINLTIRADGRSSIQGAEKRSERGRRKGQKGRCLNCGKPGHYAKTCKVVRK